MAIRDLVDLQSESFTYYLTDDYRVTFQTKNPCYYPTESRVPILEDFQYLIERDLRDLNEKRTRVNKNVTAS